MIKCEKGEKQHKMCKEANADYCSDCPHGVKENSIEEDIKILENFINWLKTDFEYNSGEEIKAIEHILEDYKRVLKENEGLKEKWDKDTHRLQNDLDVANADKFDLIQQNEELKHKIEGQECVIETQAHSEEVYEKLVMKLEKENKELKEEKDADYTTVYLKRCL